MRFKVTIETTGGGYLTRHTPHLSPLDPGYDHARAAHLQMFAQMGFLDKETGTLYPYHRFYSIQEVEE